MKKNISVVFLTFVLVAFFQVKPAFAAANLYLAPASGSVAVGSILSVTVRVNTGGEAVNAISAYVNYPADFLDYLSIGGGSILTVWAERVGGGGLVKMTGGLFPPGFTGNGVVGTINFRVKKVGTATLSFAGGSHVVTISGNNDILNLGSSTGGVYTLVQAIPTQPKPTATPIIPLKISNLKVNILDSKTVVISWETSAEADSLVEYGIEPNKYILTAYKAEKTKFHSVNLIGLAPDSKFYFRVRSKDDKGNEVTSTGSFKTKNEGKIGSTTIAPTEKIKAKFKGDLKSLLLPASLIVFFLLFFIVSWQIVRIRNKKTEKNEEIEGQTGSNFTPVSMNDN